MLLEFKTKNYKSFVEELTFSLIPAPKQKGLDYSILSSKVSRKTYKSLCSAVIYGPNASGKTNIIGAMETLKSIVLRGHIRNDNTTNSLNHAADHLELIPNVNLSDGLPVSFSIKFIEDHILFQYDLSIDFGSFLEENFSRKIVSELLKINECVIFKRANNLLEEINVSSIKKYLINGFGAVENVLTKLATDNLNEEELFLVNGFKTMFSAKLVSLFTNWLSRKFRIIYRADSVETVYDFANLDPAKKHVEVLSDQIMNEAATAFGINSNRIGYRLSKNRSDSNPPKLCSMFLDPDNPAQGFAIPAETFESYGTVRFISLFPWILRTLLHGGVLVVDEFDASIHPMALISIINLFHNDEINIHNAQLIFNTHNPIFLNSNLFRRDEIKFVERNLKTHESTQYSLSDFGTSGKDGVRQNEDYMKNYFISRYGAIEDIDFTPLFEKIIHSNKKVVEDAQTN